MKKKMSREEIRMIWGQITARAWEDAKFKEKLLAHPRETLAEYGIDVPANLHCQIHENTHSSVHWVLREKPEGLSAVDLKKIAAAGEAWTST